ncbi:virB8 family protein [Photobacterium carnosum]|uniref:virB8 family protein n=1 Tax=Photobacterium carnosum TaxID=2023717 RepID=UPI001E339943|nr:type IV secretion system protein [Photobacterium carnosum]MCD9538972.1 type IV secretion system protein VirB8 [Photobacterium carnosum]MCF2163674.1 type IV secretion system protein VirB8 [Photobacterium carnosum]MCF2307918.1 type IV secretion system protein VirB8 [Photobacterium carnosum]
MVKSTHNKDAEQALNFEVIKEVMYVKSERRAWRVAIGFFVLLLLSILANVFLIPLKSIQPYVVQVDKQTGYSQLLTVLKSKDVTNNQVLNNYWLVNYLRWHESYNWQTIQHDYNMTVLFSSPTVASPYIALFNGDEAPNKKWGESTVVTVKILSEPIISEGNDGTSIATVRFAKTIKNTYGTIEGTTQNFVATIAFMYLPISTMTAAQRLKNPLGFTVISYQVNTEL